MSAPTDPIDLSTYSGDAPRCPTCFRPKATPEDTGGPRDSARCWRTLAHKGAAGCDANRLDLARFGGDALVGCVLLDDDDVEDRQWAAAHSAGLVRASQREDGEWYGYRTELGDRVLAALRAELEGLCKWEMEVLAGKSDGWGAAVGAAIEALRGYGLMDGSWRVTPTGSAVLALHEMEVSRGK